MKGKVAADSVLMSQAERHYCCGRQHEPQQAKQYLLKESEGLIDVHGLLGYASLCTCLCVALTASQIHQIELASI